MLFPLCTYMHYYLAFMNFSEMNTLFQYAICNVHTTVRVASLRNSRRKGTLPGVPHFLGAKADTSRAVLCPAKKVVSTDCAVPSEYVGAINVK